MSEDNIKTNKTSKDSDEKISDKEAKETSIEEKFNFPLH